MGHSEDRLGAINMLIIISIKVLVDRLFPVVIHISTIDSISKGLLNIRH